MGEEDFGTFITTYPRICRNLAGCGKVATTDEEPILGATYLPRKFKTTVVIPPQNDVDLHANDLNFVAVADKGKLIGFNVLVGDYLLPMAIRIPIRAKPVNLVTSR